MFSLWLPEWFSNLPPALQTKIEDTVGKPGPEQLLVFLKFKEDDCAYIVELLKPECLPVHALAISRAAIAHHKEADSGQCSGLQCFCFLVASLFGVI